jgi:hypothetical protein
MNRVLLIRHGETHGYFDDVGLTEHGEDQCRAKGDELAGELPAGARVALVHAPTARATATARMLREVLAARRADLDLGDPKADGRFDSLQFLHEGAARESSGVAAHRLQHAREAAERSGAVVVLKGDDTIVARPGGPLAISPGGSPALATAGTGDVLSGVIGALLAKRMDAFEAASLGVLAHALAAEAAAGRLGADFVMAGDVIEALPEAFAPGQRQQ